MVTGGRRMVIGLRSTGEKVILLGDLDRPTPAPGPGQTRCFM
jgi:hypothetical protein